MFSEKRKGSNEDDKSQEKSCKQSKLCDLFEDDDFLDSIGLKSKARTEQLLKSTKQLLDEMDEKDEKDAANKPIFETNCDHFDVHNVEVLAYDEKLKTFLSAEKHKKLTYEELTNLKKGYSNCLEINTFINCINYDSNEEEENIKIEG
jgi:hypothetical protein